MSIAQDWQTAFSQSIGQREAAQVLKQAALDARMGDWTAALTDVSVGACEMLGWQASAKGHALALLPEPRS